MENDQKIEVPREKQERKNNRVTKEIEAYLLDVFSENEEEPFTNKELIEMVRSQFSHKYGNDLEAHVSWALDMLHSNGMFIKRVAPSTFENVDGPDETYSERETGYVEPGQFTPRGKNFNQSDTSKFKNKQEYNEELSKTELSVRMLKNMGKGREDVEMMLLAGDAPFNPVAVKIALKKYFDKIEV